MDNTRTLRRLPISLSVLVVALLLVALLAPLYDFAVISGTGDYGTHHLLAISLRDGEMLAVPHVLYHFFHILLGDALALTYYQTAFALVVVFRVVTAIFIFLTIALNTILPSKLVVLITVAFLSVTPAYLFSELPYNIGYFNYATYHNPTQILLSAFAIPVSLIALRAVVPQPFKNLNQRIFLTILSGLVVLAMSLSKPSYTIALLPGLSLLAVYRLARRLPVDWSLLMLGVILPQAFILLLQYLAAYGNPQIASVRIGFLVFLNHWGIGLAEALAKLFLSVAFPLIVYTLHYMDARKDSYLNMSWLIFGISCIWAYFFYEDGPRLGHGNFVWTAHVALFVLMFSSILFLIKHYTKRPQPESPAPSTGTQHQPELVKEAELN
ncbi:MAG: hypothetical protein J7551_09325 [Chloroflexi bacterium]|nr:hypothetical protein [Chloroflexota bacterium]